MGDLARKGGRRGKDTREGGGERHGKTSRRPALSRERCRSIVIMRGALGLQTGLQGGKRLRQAAITATEYIPATASSSNIV